MGRTASQASIAWPDERIDRLGEGRARSCGPGRRASRRGSCGRSRDGVLPADAADAQPDDLVAAEAAEEPRHRQRAHQLDGIAVPGLGRGREIGAARGGGPAHSSFAHTSSAITRGAGPISALTARGRGEGPGRIEAAGDPAPLLAVAKELAHGAEIGLLRSGATAACPSRCRIGIAALREVADAHAIDGGDVGGAQVARPGARAPAIGGMLGGEPAPGFEHADADMPPGGGGQGGRGFPAMHPGDPRRVDAVDDRRLDHRGVGAGHEAQRCQRALHLKQLRPFLPTGGRRRASSTAGVSRGRSMREVHHAGEKCFVDYAGQKPRHHRAATGEVTEVELFVAVLGASNYTYAEATRTQQVADWLASHVRAFEFLGGVTARRGL